MIPNKTYIKRWKQTKFNPIQIEDTKKFMEKPLIVDFPIDCIFSLDTEGNCTFFLEKESMDKCTEFGESFDWKDFAWALTKIKKLPIENILEYYFLTQPEMFGNNIYNCEVSEAKPLSYFFSKKEMDLLKSKGYASDFSGKPMLMDILGLKRLLLRFAWEDIYYKKPYKICYRNINYRLVKEVHKSVISAFHGIDEVKDGIYYIFNPLSIESLSGSVIKVDENTKDYQLLMWSNAPGDKILVVPNARPEIVKYFDIKGVVGFISEEGGATSHSVVIARERNITCAVGVPTIMKDVNLGDYVEIDMKNEKINITKVKKNEN
jgi:phosphohistidine swiveling domain-containing protein